MTTDAITPELLVVAFRAIGYPVDLAEELVEAHVAPELARLCWLMVEKQFSDAEPIEVALIAAELLRTY